MRFNGTYTIQNVKTGEHRTFRIRTQKETARFAPGKRTVALLTGPNNELDYDSFGFVINENIFVWSQKRGQGKMSAYDWYAFMLQDLADNNGDKLRELGKDYRIMLEKRCIRCNRKLTHPDSIASGIGPECASRI